MKRSIKEFRLNPREILKLVTNKGLVCGILLYFVGAVFYLFALSSGELSFVYPIFASTFLFVLILSIFVLKEKTSWVRVVGVGLVVLGIVLVALTY